MWSSDDFPDFIRSTFQSTTTHSHSRRSITMVGPYQVRAIIYNVLFRLQDASTTFFV